MKKIDARKLNEKEQIKIRKQAFDLLNNGYTNREVAKRIGVHEVTISVWKKKGLSASKKGVKKGQYKKLTKKDELNIYNLLCDSIPKEIDSHSLFWTKKSINILIENEFDKYIPSSTLGDYLKEWNLNSDHVKKFKLNFINKLGNDTYENIKIKAKESYAKILWIQVIKNNSNIGTQETANDYYHFIINNNTGLLMIRIYSSPDLIKNFKDFLIKVTEKSNKYFLCINGLTEDQYDNLNNYINHEYKNQILYFIPLFI